MLTHLVTRSATSWRVVRAAAARARAASARRQLPKSEGGAPVRLKRRRASTAAAPGRPERIGLPSRELEQREPSRYQSLSAREPSRSLWRPLDARDLALI